MMAVQGLLGVDRLVCQDLVLCRASAISRKVMFSAASDMEAPTHVEVTGDKNRDRVFFGDVLDRGPGIEQHGQRNAMVAEIGATVLCNENTLSYRVNERGAALYLLRNPTIAATIDRETFRLTPVQHYILVRENEDRALALSSRGPIWVPTMGIETDDEASRHRQGLVAEYGEVVAQGPGRWEDGQHIRPTCQPGDMIMYDCSHSTLPVTIRGEAFTLVSASQVAMVYRG